MTNLYPVEKKLAVLVDILRQIEERGYLDYDYYEDISALGQVGGSVIIDGHASVALADLPVLHEALRGLT